MLHPTQFTALHQICHYPHVRAGFFCQGADGGLTQRMDSGDRQNVTLKIPAAGKVFAFIAGQQLHLDTLCRQYLVGAGDTMLVRAMHT